MKKLLSIVLSLCMLIPSVMTISMATGTFSNQEGNLLSNPQFEFTYDGSAYTVDGWKLPSIATIEEGADGYNIITIATSNTDSHYALSSTENLNLDTDKYYKFSIMYKLQDPPSGQFNINNGVFFTYKYNNTYVNRGSLSKNTSWTEASFIMYGGDVSEGAWDKFFAIVSNYSRCTLSVKMPSVTVYNPDELDLKQDVVSENLIPNGNLADYDASTNTFNNFLIESTTSAWYDSHSKETVTIGGSQMNALRLTVNKENENRRARMLFDGNSFSKTGTYKFSLWIKLENSSATGIFDNNSNFGAIKLYFHHGTTNNISTSLIQTKGDWQRLEFILDESVHGGTTWWDLNQFAVGIQVYSMQCDILLADLRLEAVPITISTDTAENGTVKINRTTANKGDSLQVLATPDSGYKLKRLYYTDGTTETDITAKKQTVAVSKTQGNHNATVYESVESDLIYSCTLSQIADYTVKAEFVSENEEIPEPEPPPLEEVPSEEATQGEYLDNYDFEAYSSGKAVSWSEGDFGDASIAYSTEAHGGKYALLMESGNRTGVPFIAQPFKVCDTSKLYKISVFAKTIDEGDRSYDGGGIKLRVSYKLNGVTSNISSLGYETLEDWTEISKIFQIPNGATDVKAVVILDCFAGKVLLDDISVTEIGNAITSEDEKFTNGDFETYYEGEFIGWTFANGGNANNSVTQDTGRTGKAAILRDTNTDHIVSLSQKVVLDRTKKYLISFYVKGTYDDDTSFYVPSWGGAYVEFTAGDDTTGKYTVSSDLITSSAPYKKVSVVVDAAQIPQDGTTGTVKFVMKYMRGIIYLDDAEITEYTGEEEEPELTLEDLYNPSFEDGSGDTFEYWTKSTGPNISLIASSDAYHKNRAVKVVSTNREAVASLSQNINNIDNAKRYSISAWVKSLGELDFAYTGAGVKLSVSYKQGEETVSTTPSVIKELSDWTKLKHYFQIPAGATDVKVKITFDCIAGEILVDNVELKTVGSAIEKIDGQFTNGGFEEYYDGEFVEWSFNNGGNDNNSVTQNTGRTGKAAIIRDTNTDHILSLSQKVVLDRTKKYLISFYVKTTYDDDTSFYVPSWGGAYVEFTAGDYSVTSELITSASPYKKVSVIVDGSKIPEGVTGTAKFVMKYMRGIIYLDDAEITEYNGDGDNTDKVPEEELKDLYNLSFEEGEGDTFEYWIKTVGPNVSLVSSKDAYHKDRAVKVVSTNREAVASLSQTINNIDSSKRYCVSFWVKALDQLDFSYSGAGVKLSVSYKLGDETVSTSPSVIREMEDWTKLKHYFQIPSGATDIKVKIAFDCFKGNVLVDKVELKTVGNAIEKKDGQFANGGFEEYYDGEFAEWSFNNGGNSNNSITQGDGRTDKAAIIRDTNTDHILSLSQKVVLDRTKKYLISFYVKGTYDDDTSFYVPSWGGAYVEFTAGNDTTGVYSVQSELITSASPYKKVSVIVDGSKIPEGVTGTAKFVMKYMRGIIYLDDAEITEYKGDSGNTDKVPEELKDLYNLSFEEGKGDTFEYWMKSVGPNISLVSSKDAYHKNRAVKVVSKNRDAVASLSQTINNIDSTKRYCISVRVKALDELDFSYSGAGVKLSVSYKLGDETVSTSPSVIREMEDWIKLKHYFQIPKGATDITAKITFDCFKGNVLVDKVELKTVGNAIEKKDGQFANGGFEEYYDGEFAEWSFNNGGNSNNSITQDKGRTGKAAILRDTNTDHILSLSQKVVLDRTKKYLISFYVKGTYDDDTSFYVPSWGGAYVEFAAGDYSVTSELITSASPYKKVSVIVDGSKIPEGVTGTAKFVMKYMRGIIYLDDAEITEYKGGSSTTDKVPEAEEDLEDLYNLSFEEGKGDTFEYWMKSAGPNISLVSSKDAYHKNRAVKAVSKNRNAVASLSQTINNIDNSKRYCISVWAKALGELDFSYTGAGVKLSVSYKLNGSNANTGASVITEMEDWTKLKHYFQIPKGATDITAKITFDCFKGKVLVDKVELKTVGNAVEKKDGQFANGGFEEYYDGEFAEWNFSNGGNPNNSVAQDTGRTGKAAVLRDTNTDHIMSFSQNVVLDRTKKYKISFFVRATSDDDTDFYVPDWGGAYIQFKAGDYTVKSEMIKSTCRYRQLSLIVDGSKIPEGVVPRVSFVMQYMRGIIYLDDAKIEVYDGTQVDEPIVYEDLYNLSFEEGKGNSFDDWNKNKGPNVEIVSTSDAHDGKRAVMIESTDRNAVAKLYQNINNWDSTKRYRITVWAKTLGEVDVAYDGGGIKLQVTYKDKDGKTQSSSSAPRRTLDDWTMLYVDYQIPKGATDVRVNLMSDCLKGKVIFDDMTISVTGKAVKMPEQDPLNLASNFSFENGQDGSFPGWYWWTNNSKNTCEVGEPHLGAQSAKVTSKVAESSAQLSWDATSLDTNGWYQFSVWVKTEDVVPLSIGNGGVCIAMQFKKPGGNTNLKVYRSDLIVGTNGWMQLVVRGRFPEGCNRVVFAMTISQATGVVYWDDVDIRKIEYTETNLLKNGSFDEADSDGNLLYWEKESDDWSFASFSHENNSAIVNNAGICSSYYYQDIEDLIFGAEYVISGNVSADSIVSDNGGAAAILEMIDVYGNVVEKRLCNDFITSTSAAVTKFNVKFKLTENCKKVRILLACNEAAGSAVFSDFKLVEVDDYSGDAAVESTVMQLVSPVLPSITPSLSETEFNFLPIIIAVSAAAVAAIAGVLTFVAVRKKRIK